MRADVKLDEWINVPSFDIAQFPAGRHYVRARNQSRDNEEGPADAAKVLDVDVKHCRVQRTYGEQYFYARA